MAEEIPFLAEQRPWDRACCMTAGTHVLDHAPHQVAVASGRGGLCRPCSAGPAPPLRGAAHQRGCVPLARPGPYAEGGTPRERNASASTSASAAAANAAMLTIPCRNAEAK